MKKTPKKHVALYEKFIEELKKPVPIFKPRARGSKRKLIPPPRKYPCDFCAHAQYNKLCSESVHCGPFLYYQFSIVKRMPE